jgi:hypothetical protein
MATRDEPMTTLISFRAPKNLVEAMRRAADKQICGLSTIARSAVAEEMRERGLLIEKEST